MDARSRISLAAAGLVLVTPHTALAQADSRDTVRIVAPPADPRELYRAHRNATRGAMLAELAAARERWRAARSPRLQFRIQIECYCFGVPSLPLYTVVEAIGDSVISVVDESGRPAGSLYPRDGRPSVPWLFAFAEEAIRGSDDQIALAFDEAMGIPTRIAINPRVRALDDELSITVSHLTVRARQ